MKNAIPQQARLGFTIHAIVFVPVMLALFAVNYLTGVYPWVLWVLLSWGIGLFAHWFFVLGPGVCKHAKP